MLVKTQRPWCQVCVSDPLRRLWCSIQRSASLCTPPRCCVEWAAWSKIRTRMAASGLRFIQYSANELRRITLPRTSLNKGKKKGRGILRKCPGPPFCDATWGCFRTIRTIVLSLAPGLRLFVTMPCGRTQPDEEVRDAWHYSTADRADTADTAILVWIVGAGGPGPYTDH